MAGQPKLPRHRRPERIAYIRRWRARNWDWLRRQARASYLRDRDLILAENRRRRESLRQFVTPEELKACQADPRRAKTIRGPNVIVCLDCGDMLETLSRHLGLVHAMTADQYRKKWGYNKNTALCAENLGRKFSGRMKQRQFQPPKKTQTRTYLTKMRVKSRAVQRAEPRRLEHRLNVRDWSIGRPRFEHWKVSDWNIVRQRLGGKKMHDIARATGLSSTEAISARLGRLGLAGERWELPVFVRGRPFTWADLHSRSREFGLTLGLAYQRAGVKYASIPASRRGRPVPKATADRLSKFFGELADRFCYRHAPGHNRVREFLPSELRELSELFPLLKEAFRQIGEWARSQKNFPRVEDMMGHICGQARREVAQERIGGKTIRTFRRLLGMGLTLETLLAEKRELVRGRFRSLSEPAAELLGRAYGTTPSRIVQAVGGNLQPLDPRTLGQAIRGELAEPVKRAISAHGKRRRPPSLKIVQKGQLCDQIIREMHQIRRFCFDGGRSIVEIQTEHPEFAAWNLRAALGEEDRDVFNHPRQWGPVRGYALMLLGKSQGRHPESVLRWVKAYRREAKAEKPQDSTTVP